MNPAEQHERRSSIDRLDQRIDALAEAVDAEVVERMHEMRQLIARLIATEHAERIATQQANDHITDRNNLAIVALTFYTSQFFTMTLPERLRWLLLGRLPEHIAEFGADPDAVIFPERRSDERLNPITENRA